MLDFGPYLLVGYLVFTVVEFADAMSSCCGIFVLRRHLWLKAGCLCGCIVAGIAWPAVAVLWLYAFVRQILQENISDSR